MATERSIFDRLEREVPKAEQIDVARDAFGRWKDDWADGRHYMFSDHLENVLDLREQRGYGPYSLRGRARHRTGYHSHPAHPSSHPISTKHRRK